MTSIGAIAGIKSVQEFKDMDRFVTAGHFRTTTLGDFLKAQRP